MAFRPRVCDCAFLGNQRPRADRIQARLEEYTYLNAAPTAHLL
jgi:hypothetical protein